MLSSRQLESDMCRPAEPIDPAPPTGWSGAEVGVMPARLST